MYECYENIVGISSIDCDCLAENRPEDYNESQSGLFLDDMAPIKSLINLNQCDETIWSLLVRTRDRAIKKVFADSNALLGKKFGLKRRIARQQVLGTIKAKDIFENTKNYAVVRLACSPIRGGVMELINGGGIFSGTGDVEVEIYDNVTGLLNSYTISTLPNQYSSTPLNIELPLYSKYTSELEYYFVYAFDQANMPKDNKLDCGCGGWVPFFNKTSPYYNLQIKRKPTWADYIMLCGLEINSLTEITGEDELISTCNNEMYGLSLELNFSCKLNEVVCETPLDFIGNPLAMSLGFAVQYIWAKYVADAIVKSDLLNRENMVNRDRWEEDSEEWNEKYMQHVNYIVDNVDHTANDCLKCKNLLELGRKGIFA